MVTEMTRQLGAHDMTFQAGKLAKLADGAVVVTYGQTQVIATCVRSKPREGSTSSRSRSTSKSGPTPRARSPARSSGVKAGRARRRSSPPV